MVYLHLKASQEHHEKGREIWNLGKSIHPLARGVRASPMSCSDGDLSSLMSRIHKNSVVFHA